jgi:hypothetical protein
MSRDQLTLKRTDSLRKRREEEQKRRETLTKKLAQKPKAVSTRSKSAPRSSPTVTPGRLRRRYDIATSQPYGRSRGGFQAPSIAITLPRVEFGPRWISFLILALCAAALVSMWTMDPFIVRGAEIHGNVRIATEDIRAALGVMNHPAALLNPAQIEYNLLYSFPDISGVQIETSLPAGVVVTISERQPVVAWNQDGQTVWVDAQGFAFPPRGAVDGLVTVQAAGTPPAVGDPSQSQSFGAHAFLSGELTSTITGLSTILPEGASIIYDPDYGLGWNDPGGWQAFFGKNRGDISAKLLVYQSLVDYLAQQNIQPELISVEFPDAPFYRVEQ